MYVLQVITFNNHISGNGVGASPHQKSSLLNGCFCFRSVFEKKLNSKHRPRVAPCNPLYLQVVTDHAVAAETQSKSQGSATKNEQLFAPSRHALSKRRPQHAVQKENPYCSLL